ncbi:hypothetical protein QBC37DRAFT_99428 [Rhypophila decipiens]|uniref:N-acetyltransferase domain-containing protein n=1 Tax=Rhypophila decipiens TaxID=261697 RepID=A0AAN6XUR3_9PEZI|nr:hypothetical protein QBC37DRAFT_99428 [Rhypophila decipiens]
MADLITSLRTASRKLVREWGFLRPSLPGMALSHLAVHCLIEIDNCSSPCAFSELCTELQVTPHDLGAVIAELIRGGYITIVPNSRPKEGHKEDHEGLFILTSIGKETLSDVNAYAQNQIAKALQVAHPTFGTDITTALGLYATALEASRLAEANPTPELTPIASPVRELASPIFPPPTKPAVRIVTGYIPGLLGRTLEMNSTYYWDLVQWGPEFESDLGAGIADLIKRLDNPLNQAWSVVRTISPPTPGKPARERIEGVIYVDGECSGEEGVAKIRAFILDDSVRGMGLGKRMVSEAMKFVRESGFRECRLTTMRMLAPAIRLYENEGFVQTGEQWESHWGKGHTALHFTWRRDQDPKIDQQQPKTTEP